MAGALSERTALIRVVRARTAAIWLLTASLVGCGSAGGEALLDNYASRLARPLEVTIAPPADRPLPAPPRAEALHLDVPGGSLDGLDFLRLRGCALQTTVARRNSSLGRLAPPSQRLLLELAFLREAPPCIDRLREEGRAELADRLAAAHDLKRAQLPALIFNATLGNREYRDFWRSKDRLGAYPEDTGSAVITALEQVSADAARWLDGDHAADEARFELALGTIAGGDGGELLLALSRQHAWLDAINAGIAARLARGPLCSGRRIPRAAPILRTVVQTFFVGEVQRWSAALNQRYHTLLGPLRDLESQLAPTLPPAYAAWREERELRLTQALDAPSIHVRRLQSLLGPCYAEFARDAGAPVSDGNGEAKGNG